MRPIPRQAALDMPRDVRAPASTKEGVAEEQQSSQDNASSSARGYAAALLPEGLPKGVSAVQPGLTAPLLDARRTTMPPPQPPAAQTQTGLHLCGHGLDLLAVFCAQMKPPAVAVAAGPSSFTGGSSPAPCPP